MEQLGDVLDELGWSKYESACYHALVKYGKMKAGDIAQRIDTQPAKVYQPLNSLRDKGHVKVRDENPQIYMAQHPRLVIQKEQEEFEQRSDEILEKLEEAWEVQSEMNPQTDETAWVLSGEGGMNTELESLVLDAEDSIVGFDTRLPFATRQVIEALEEKARNDVSVEIVGTPHSESTLDRLAEASITTNQVDLLHHSAYYVVDESKVLLNIGRQKATIGFEDESIARIIIDDFKTYGQGNDDDE